MEHSNTLRQFKQRVEESNKQKTKKQKRQDKINKLSSLDKHWKGLEHIDHSQLIEDIAGLNKALWSLEVSISLGESLVVSSGLK